MRAASANVHSKVFDDEVVVLDMKSGTYFSLRGAGVDIWRLIEENASCTGIVEALEGRFDASRIRDRDGRRRSDRRVDGGGADRR